MLLKKEEQRRINELRRSITKIMQHVLETDDEFTLICAFPYFEFVRICVGVVDVEVDWMSLTAQWPPCLQMMHRCKRFRPERTSPHPQHPKKMPSKP